MKIDLFYSAPVQYKEKRNETQEKSRNVQQKFPTVFSQGTVRIAYVHLCELADSFKDNEACRNQRIQMIISSHIIPPHPDQLVSIISYISGYSDIFYSAMMITNNVQFTSPAVIYLLCFSFKINLKRLAALDKDK